MSTAMPCGASCVNLLDNAVRYGPEGQTLRITAINRDERLELAVEDEGPGVPPDDRERVWEPFERGSTNAWTPAPASASPSCASWSSCTAATRGSRTAAGVRASW